MPRKLKAGVSANVMALHLGLARPYLAQLVADSIIEKLPDGGFDLDKTRLAYIRHLRRARRTSPETTARAQYDQAKARDLAVRSAIREGTLMHTEEAIAIVDELVGITVMSLTALPVRVTRDAGLRKVIESEIFALRQSISERCAKRAAELETAANKSKAKAAFPSVGEVATETEATA
jgi:hypothetical protein